jgi:hypothetical protein
MEADTDQAWEICDKSKALHKLQGSYQGQIQPQITEKTKGGKS